MHLDNTFFAFVALVMFLGIVFYAGAHKKAGAALDARADQISKDIADARKLREEAEALLAEYKQKKLDAEKEAWALSRKRSLTLRPMPKMPKRSWRIH